MTVMTERTPHMSVGEFEAIARFAEKETEAVRFEFIGGRIEEKGVPDGDHNRIWLWLSRLCMQHRPDLGFWGGDLGLIVEGYREGRARPDGVLAPLDFPSGQGEWMDPDGVLMTVEITSYDSDTDRRDRREKPVAYALAGIPVYLLIDRDACALVVHSDPSPDGYRDVHTVLFGKPVTLPKPVGFTVETEALKDYAR